MTKEKIKIISVDMSLTNTGLAVLSGEDMSLVDYRNISRDKSSSKNASYSINENIYNTSIDIVNTIKELVGLHFKKTPVVIVFEDMIKYSVKTQTRTLISLGKLHQSVFTLLEKLKLEQGFDILYFYISPTRWQNGELNLHQKRKNMKDNGEAIPKDFSKLNSVENVRKIYNIDIDADVADSINIGRYFISNSICTFQCEDDVKDCLYKTFLKNLSSDSIYLESYKYDQGKMVPEDVGKAKNYTICKIQKCIDIFKDKVLLVDDERIIVLNGGNK